MAINKILTDLDIDGVVDIATTNTDNDSTNGIDIDMTKNSTGTGYATSIKGINAEVDNSGSAQYNANNGIRTVAKHSGTGDGYFLSGSLTTATNEGSGAISGFYGRYTTMNSNGTGVQDVDYMMGNTIAMNFNNANLDVNRVGAINAQLNFNAATTINTEAYVCLLDTDFTGVTGTDVTVDGDFSYLFIKPHSAAHVPDVTGSARAINSESTLPSRFAGDMHFEGNVGIGTTSPSQKLDVLGKIKVVSETASVPTITIKDINNAFQAGVESSGNLAMKSATDTYFYSGGNNSRMVIKSTGEVGIGTTSPNYALDVVGSLNNVAKLTSSTTKSQLLFVDANSTDTVAIGSQGDDFNVRVDNGNIKFQTNSGATATTRMIVNSSGNVGIGITDPDYRLHIEDDSTAYDTSVGIKVDATKNHTNTTGWSGNVFGISASATNEGVGKMSGIYGARLYAEETGTTGAYFIIGSNNFAKHNGSGDSGAIWGSYNSASVIGTGTGTHPYLVGSQAMSTLDNSNASVGRMSGLLAELNLKNGEVTTRADGAWVTLQSTTGSATAYDANVLYLKMDDSNLTVTNKTRVVYSPSNFPSYFEGGIGIGTDDPKAKLDVDGGIRMGNDTTAASADNEGTMRYYTDAFGSYVDMVMETDTSTYAWVNIVRNIFSV